MYSDSVVNFDGLSRHFIWLHEDGKLKEFTMTLNQNVDQNYQTPCGSLAYEMEIVDQENFSEVFVLDGFEL